MLSFSSKPLLVIGDLILDSYLSGTSTRLSPEAPVPVVNLNNTVYSLGGACNVAANLYSLGGNPITIGIVGKDADGDGLAGLYQSTGMSAAGIVRSEYRRTTTKTRVTVNRHQIVRMDKEDTTSLLAEERTEILWRLKTLCGDAAAIIISDYAKGIITASMLQEIKNVADTQQIPIFLDPRVTHGNIYAVLSGALTCITPNMSEIAGLARMQVDTIPEAIDAGKVVLYAFGCKYLLITMGEHGMALLTQGKDTPEMLETAAREVFDVAGAGDTVIAALALASISGYSMEASARLANLAAGIVVSKAGTAIATLDELQAASA